MPCSDPFHNKNYVWDFPSSYLLRSQRIIQLTFPSLRIFQQRQKRFSFDAFDQGAKVHQDLHFLQKRLWFSTHRIRDGLRVVIYIEDECVPHLFFLRIEFKVVQMEKVRI